MKWIFNLETQISTQTSDEMQETAKQEWQTPQLMHIELEETESGVVPNAFVEGFCDCLLS